MAKSCEQLRNELRILMNPHAPPSEKKDEEIEAISQQLKDQNCNDLTGFWSADDGGFYYLRQDGEILWWVGLSNDPDPELNGEYGLQFGLTFSNIFRGQVSTDTIRGVWADVPRGITHNNGTLSLRIGTADDGVTPFLEKIDFSGGFGATIWQSIGGVPQDINIQDVFNLVKKNQLVKGGLFTPPDISLGDNLKPFKDHTVVFGSLFVDPEQGNLLMHVNYPPDLNNFGLGRSYADFICLFGNQSPPDGDLNTQIVITRQIKPSFWTDGWVNGVDPEVIKTKLDAWQGELHLEAIMFGRTARCYDKNGIEDFQHHKDPPLLPGWQEQRGNSVLLNGRPINGQLELLGDPESATSSVGSLLGKKVGIDTNLFVRVTGVLVLDCGHYDAAHPDLSSGDIGLYRPCYEDDPEQHNIEIHPVYAIDIIDNTPSDDLSGTWSDDDGKTYYIRQLDDNNVWGLGVSPFRDHSFARVFQGIKQDQTITAQWVDVPLGQGQGSGSLTLRIDPGKLILFANSSDGVMEQQWTKFYHLFPPPPPPPPAPSVSIVGDTEIPVDSIDLKNDPTVTASYTIVPVSLQDPLTVDWSSNSRHVQFADHTAQSTDITFVWTGRTTAGNRRIFKVDVSVTDALGTQVSDSVTVTIAVTPTT